MNDVKHTAVRSVIDQTRDSNSVVVKENGQELGIVVLLYDDRAMMYKDNTVGKEGGVDEVVSEMNTLLNEFVSPDMEVVVNGDTVELA